ncbi:zinc finger CCCH domain-containing protein 39 isoform X1 [Dendrobium catenatum]|uniref:Zinc finger CCCH domain-containing protein 56 n=1 Tax=Dendrobium catenatum TaxID=906689 RepID=A0A2I0VNE0_9ASPA|nr:zinc finger CCCH domain-containing protein 39 isoform X1 [Dendrobium catenatum]PKU64926.1 Zinc finger CCCH domain-containing protein 56 [Dendrobium catenatum]
MDHPFAFPGPFDFSITTEQRISEEIGNCPQIPPFFPNLTYHGSSTPQSVYFKTRMCVKFMSGSCSKGGSCNFAHSIEELRRPAGNVDVRALFPQVDGSRRNEQNPIISGELFDAREKQKLHRNKVCWKFYHGELCPYGDKCSFSHVQPGSLQDSSLPSQKPMCWKTKICHKWSTSGSCSYGDQCSYAHGHSELRKLGGDNDELVEKNVVAARPKCAINITDEILSKTTAEPRESREAAVSQPKIRTLTLKKISRIYGDWIDDFA